MALSQNGLTSVILVSSRQIAAAVTFFSIKGSATSPSKRATAYPLMLRHPLGTLASSKLPTWRGCHDDDDDGDDLVGLLVRRLWVRAQQWRGLLLQAER